MAAHASSSMRFAFRAATALFLLVILAGASACQLPGSSAGNTASSSRQASSHAAPSPPGQLDAAAPTPAGFPAGVAGHTRAGRAAGAACSANGITAWGIEWETLDSVDKVRAFY